MTPLAKFAHKFDELIRKNKASQKIIKLKEPTIRLKKLITVYFLIRFVKFLKVHVLTSDNLKLQKLTLKINSILDKGLSNFYKLIAIF